MSPIALLALLGWIPVAFYLYKRFPVQQAVIISFIGAWLFLPVAKFPLPGLPNLDKMSATCYGILLATIFFDIGRFKFFKPSWLDLPILIWCFCPFASSIDNDLGPYDGLSAALDQTVTWGLPYFLGRLYLNNLEGLRQLSIAIFMGGLLYIPLCLLENIISPQLHKIVYGFYAHKSGIDQSYRYGGWRPMVFMSHGLMVGVWMMSATLIGIWLWKTGVIKKIWRIPMGWAVVVLFITFILCRSTGAYILLALGLIILFVARWLRTAFPLLLLILGISSYLYIGVTGAVSVDQIISFTAAVTNEDRAQSLGFRLKNEELLSDKARMKMIFGWGGWGRALINYRYKGAWGDLHQDTTIVDSLWIITFGNHGVVGLGSLTASLLLPAGWFVLRYPSNGWSHRQVAPIAPLAVLLCLYMLDCVLNAMVNPVFALISGGISGLVLQKPENIKGRRRNIRGISRDSLPSYKQQQG